MRILGINLSDTRPASVLRRARKDFPVDQRVFRELALVGFFAVIVECSVGMVIFVATRVPALVLLALVFFFLLLAI